MWIPRLLEPVLRDRVRTRPVVVLTGARQTGQTSLVRRLFPRWTYVSLDLPREAEEAEHEPERFLERHPPPASAIVCPCANPFPLAPGVEAFPLAEVPRLLRHDWAPAGSRRRPPEL